KRRQSRKFATARGIGLKEICATPPMRDDQDYDLYLDQWTGKENPSSEELRSEINPRFAAGEGNLDFDLSLQGCLKANRSFQTRVGTSYFSLVTRATHEVGLPIGPKVQQADGSMSSLLKGPAEYQALRPDFAAPPIPGWGLGDLVIGKWRE